MSDTQKDTLKPRLPATPYDEVCSSLTPRMGNALTRAIGRLILRLTGWNIAGKLPDVKKVVFIGAPHTSNWDFIIAMGSILATGLKCSWMMKKEAFFWPLGPVWKALGGIPIDRKGPTNITEQIADWFETNNVAWLGITPEGTRSKVDRFKSGYLRFAYAANAPVFIVAVDAQRKQVVLDKLFPLTGDLDADNAAIKKYYDDNYVGINPN